MVSVIVALVLFAAPLLVSPQNNITVSSSRLEWQIPDYPLYSGNHYRVQLDDDPAFSSINKDYYTVNNYYTPKLSYSTWNWRVKAKDDIGTWSDWSEIWSFTLSEATPSSTPNPTPTSTPTPTPIPTSTRTPSPTSNPTPKKTTSPTNQATAIPTSTPQNTPTLKPTNSTVITYRIASVAAATMASPSATPQVSIKSQKQTNLSVWVGLIFIFGGIGSIGYIYLKSNGKIPFKFR